MSVNYIKIGKTIIKDDFEKTENSEFAAWYTTRKVPAGEHNLYAAKNVRDGGFSLTVEIENAVITSQNTQSHFGGVGYGTDPGEKDIGTLSPINLRGELNELSRDGNFQHVIESTWVSIEDGKVVFNPEHKDYLNAVKDHRTNFVKELFQDVYVGNPRLLAKIESLGWFENEKMSSLIQGKHLSKAVDKAMTYSTMQYDHKRELLQKFNALYNVDGVLNSHTGKGIDGNNLDANDVLDIYSKQNGMVSSFDVLTVSRLAKEGKIEFKDNSNMESSY